MADINKVVLLGRLTRDCEVKALSNTNLCTFSIAVNRRVNQNGNWVDEPNFFDIELFGNLGPAIQPYLVKGQQVAVEGSLRQSRWEDQSGQKRSKVSINASNVQLLGGGQGRGQHGYQEQTPQQNAGVPGMSNGNSGGTVNNQQQNFNNQGMGQRSPQINQLNQGSGMEDLQDDIPF